MSTITREDLIEFLMGMYEHLIESQCVLISIKECLTNKSVKELQQIIEDEGWS